MGNYLAMSEAFPYLQAGSQKDLIFGAIAEGRGVGQDVQITSVVGNFLSWDETGGFELMRRGGIEQLPDILDTRRFHANLLRQDLQVLFGQDVAPSYSAETRAYLLSLYDGLSSANALIRCAHMVSFEKHAGEMISTLWAALVPEFSVPREQLSYFQTHVGGPDPAEAHHIAMTKRMLDRLVPGQREDEFLDMFREAYRLHVRWCSALVGCGGSGEVAA